MLGKTVAGLLAVLVVVFLVGGGGYSPADSSISSAPTGRAPSSCTADFPYVLPFGHPDV